MALSRYFLILFEGLPKPRSGIHGACRCLLCLCDYYSEAQLVVIRSR